MKIYHTETQEDYDALMVELESQGCKWLSGRKPTETTKNWKRNSSETCVRVGKKMAMYDKKSYYTWEYPRVPIIKYKAKADEKMKFTKENVVKVINEYILQAVFDPCNDLIAEIHNLDDTPEKVAVPEFIANYLRRAKTDIGLMRVFEIANTKNELERWKKEYDWIRKNSEKFAKAWIDGYTIEQDTVPEQYYTVVIADRYLVHLFLGRTDYMFVKFDELWAFNPRAFQLTEAEIKAIGERYWTFAKPIEEENE